uniref:nucleolar and coiled-body phosphoprotein 1-like isoform X3 n=1 Tax=Gasterosteus aculeatus aculeatus TaxID=481459 RepID=UPI001A997030|nr:nucleolar and coiled-body phosphoprotein 1-like isoform X3 [Gasterosteus aculeatus aculeatus]
MAGLKRNLLSREHVTGSERNTFTRQETREQRRKMRPPLWQPDRSPPQIHQQLNAMHLQQRLRYLKKREFTAQENNRLLLQQFEEAQDTVKEMLIQNAAMKTIRTAYERYLEVSCPRWQQQLKEKTQVAQTKRTEYLRSCLKNTEERGAASSADPPLLSQASTTVTQHITAPPEHYSPNCHLDYNQDGSPHLCYAKPSWQNRLQSQTDRFPIRGPHQPQGSSHVPPAFLPPHIFPHPHPLQLHLPGSSPGDRRHGPGPNPPGLAALQTEYLRSWAAGPPGTPSVFDALWSQLFTEEIPPEMGMVQVVGEESDPCRAPSSKRETGGGGSSSHLSQELDSKPVRLSGSLAESSSEPSRASSKKRNKREERRSRCSISGSRSCSSQESSRGSSAVAAVKVFQSSESDASSEKRSSTGKRTRRSGGLSVGSPRDEKVVKGSEGSDPGSHKEESRPPSEEEGSLEFREGNTEDTNPDDKAESCGEESGSQEEESGSVCMNIEDGRGDEPGNQESSSSEENTAEEDEKDGEEDDGAAEEKEDRQTDKEQEKSDVKEDHGASGRKNATQEDEETQETGAEDEEQESEDEEVGEEEGDREEESDEEEHRDDAAGEPEEKSDSDDSIISPQDKSRKIHVIHEEGSEEDEEEEEGSRMGSSEDDDVESLLAPQQPSEKKKEKDPRADEQPKAICDVSIFQAEPNKSTKCENDDLSDSDEFDHFFD